MSYIVTNGVLLSPPSIDTSIFFCLLMTSLIMFGFILLNVSLMFFKFLLLFKSLQNVDFKLQLKLFNLTSEGSIKPQFYSLKPKVSKIIKLVLIRMNKMGRQNERFNILLIPVLPFQLMLQSHFDFGTSPSLLSFTTSIVYHPELMALHPSKLSFSLHQISHFLKSWLCGLSISSTVQHS